MSIVRLIRESWEEWKEYKNKYGDFAEIKKLPVREWEGFMYIVTGKIDLREGRQNLLVIDITNCFDKVAFFADSYPEQTNREYAIVIFPDEGQISVLMESGSELWFNLGVLPICIEPGTVQDYQEMKIEEMERMEAWVDAGGSICL